METTLFYARAACDTMMHKFAVADLPPKGHFYYHQGVFLSGVLKTWQLTGEQKYFGDSAIWVYAVSRYPSRHFAVHPVRCNRG